MSNLLTTTIDGLSVAATHWQSLLGILLILVLSQFLMYSALKNIFGDRFTAEEYYSLSLAGWMLPALLISLFWYSLGTILSPQISAPIGIIFAFIAGLILSARAPKTTSNILKLMALSLLLLTVLFIVLRLAFVAKAIFPLYFDSAQHYLYIKNLLANLNGSDTPWSLANYYHLGFHFLAAFITFITRTQINDTMLILGQVILAVMPLSAFFIVRHWTGSNTAGIFAIILAAFGWYMPAHAMDWGKYPALTSLGLIPFVLSIAYLSVQNRMILPIRKYWGLNAILLAGIITTVFLHSRELIVFGIATAAWIMTAFWQRMQKPLRLVVLGISILVLIGEIAIIQNKGILGPLFDPYAPTGLLITSIVLFLSVFAFWTHPRLVFFSTVAVFLLLISLFIPLGNLIPGYANTTVLDRPFVEMILYMPLTLLGGFGLESLGQMLQDKKIVWGKVQLSMSKTIAIFFILLIVVNASFKYDLYPSDCCDIVSHDDLTAIDWMDKNLPQDARVLISSTELNVLPTDAYQGSAGGDAGTWINPLIGRTTIFMPFTTDFNQGQTLDAICQSQVGHVYVGKTGWAFNDSGMNPDFYKIVFSMPKAKVYEVIGCN